MDNQREIVQFQIEDLRLDVHLFFKEETAWLSLNDISLLFEKDKSVISRHIKKSLKEHGDQAQTVAKIATVKREGNKVVRRLIDYYNLDVVMPIATRIESRKALLLKDSIDEYFRNLGKANNTGPIVVFESGNVSLPVRVSPEENTVWLDKDGLVSLFGTTRQNVEYNIANIYGQGELEEGATCKEVLQVQDEAKQIIRTAKEFWIHDLVFDLPLSI